MISNQDKQAILNGAYGVSRKGLKCKFIGFTGKGHSYIHMFIYFNTEGFINNVEYLNEDFNNSTAFESPEDVIGLWEDKPEPFNLDKALKGEPVMTRAGNKAYIKYQLSDEYTGAFPLGGYIKDPENELSLVHCTWSLTGKTVEIECDNPQDIIGMWQEPDSEPESVTAIFNLPAPLTKPQDNMYYVNQCGTCWSGHNRNMDINLFNERVYFASEENARAWFNAMKNHK